VAVFAVIEGAENPALAANIRRIYPDDHLKLSGPGQWLISDTGSAKTVSDKLGLEKGSGFSATLVVAISSYFGLHSSDIWDWIRTKVEARP
jgi:hypothetical protein